jgi:hypothetical protein
MGGFVAVQNCDISVAVNRMQRQTLIGNRVVAEPATAVRGDVRAYLTRAGGVQ